MSGWNGKGSDSRWRKLRAFVLARDEYQCQVRGPGCTGKANTVDHVIALNKGGAKYQPSNLVAACAACNNWKSDKDIARNFNTLTEW